MVREAAKKLYFSTLPPPPPLELNGHRNFGRRKKWPALNPFYNQDICFSFPKLFWPDIKHLFGCGHEENNIFWRRRSGITNNVVRTKYRYIYFRQTLYNVLK